MRERRVGWLDALQDLGDAAVEMVRAELAVITDRWQKTVVQLLKIVVLLFLVAVVFFYLPFLVILTLVDALRAAAGWPIWAAAATVLGLALLVCLVLALIAKYLFSRTVEGPTTTVRRRLDDASGWWHARIVHEPHRLRRRPDELPQ